MKPYVLCGILLLICQFSYGQRTLTQVHDALNAVELEIGNLKSSTGRPRPVKGLLRLSYDSIVYAKQLLKIDPEMASAENLNEIIPKIKSAAESLEYFKGKSTKKQKKKECINDDEVVFFKEGGEKWAVNISKTKAVIKELESINFDLGMVIESLVERNIIEDEYQDQYRKISRRDLTDISYSDFEKVEQELLDLMEKLKRYSSNSLAITSKVNDYNFAVEELQNRIKLKLQIDSIHVERYVGPLIGVYKKAAAININNRLEAEGFKKIPILKISIDCQDELCKEISIKLTAGPPSVTETGGVDINETFEVGVPYTGSSQYATKLFLEEVILPILIAENIPKKDIDVLLTGTADGHKINSPIPFDEKKCCCEMRSMDVTDLNTMVKNNMTVKDNLIRTNGELSFARAFCMMGVLQSSLGIDEDKIKMYTRTFSEKGADYRKIEMEVRIKNLVDPSIYKTMERRARELLPIRIDEIRKTYAGA